MNRRRLLQTLAAAIPFLPGIGWPALAPAPAMAAARQRVRPGDPAWPSEASWDRLEPAVGGRLVKVRSPLAACLEAPASPDCAQLFKALKNPYYLGDEVGLTQTLGWVERLDVAAERLRGGRPRRRTMWSRPSISPARTICGSS